MEENKDDDNDGMVTGTGTITTAATLTSREDDEEVNEQNGNDDTMNDDSRRRRAVDSHDDSDSDEDDDDDESMVVEPLPMDQGEDEDGDYDEELMQIQEEAIRRIQRIWRTANRQERRKEHHQDEDGEEDDCMMLLLQQPQQPPQQGEPTSFNATLFGSKRGGESQQEQPDPSRNDRPTKRPREERRQSPLPPQQQQFQQNRWPQDNQHPQQQYLPPLHPPPPYPYYFHPLPVGATPPPPPPPPPPNFLIDNSIPLSPTTRPMNHRPPPSPHPPILTFPGHHPPPPTVTATMPYMSLQDSENNNNNNNNNADNGHRGNGLVGQNQTGQQRSNTLSQEFGPGPNNDHDGDDNDDDDEEQEHWRQLQRPPESPAPPTDGRANAMEPRTWWDTTGEQPPSFAQQNSNESAGINMVAVVDGNHHRLLSSPPTQPDNGEDDDGGPMLAPPTTITNDSLDHRRRRFVMEANTAAGPNDLKPPPQSTAAATAPPHPPPPPPTMVAAPAQNRRQPNQCLQPPPPTGDVTTMRPPLPMFAFPYGPYFVYPPPYPFYYPPHSYMAVVPMPQGHSQNVTKGASNQGGAISLQPKAGGTGTASKTNDNKNPAKQSDQEDPTQTTQPTSNQMRERRNTRKPGHNNNNNREKCENTYILRMNDILEDAEREGYTHVVGWLSHGRAFRVHVPEMFYNLVLPKYFATNKKASFTRWLRAWGFSRLTEGRDRGAWYHRYFIRGVVTSLVKDLTRKQMKEAMEGWLSSCEAPDFYHLAVTIDDEQHIGLRKQRSLSASKDASTGGAQNEHQDIGISDDTTMSNEAQSEQNPITNGSDGLGKGRIPLNNPIMLRGTILASTRQMLSDAEEKKFTHIVSWLEHGKAWKIHKRKEFTSQIMSTYFEATQLTHISDTLRRWGFRRLKNATETTDRNAYYHCRFQRHQPKLCRHLTQEQMQAAMKNFHLWKVGEPGGLDLREEGTEGDENNRTNIPKIPPRIKPISTKPKRLEEKNECVVNGDTSALAFSTNGIPMGIDLPSTANHRVPVEPGGLESTSGSPAGAATAKAVTVTTNDERNALSLQPTAAAADVPKYFSEHSNATYVARVHKMLEDSEREGNGHLIGWRPHGRAFAIYHADEFAEVILPRYFNASYASFTRWLRAWGFETMKGGKDRKCWYHRLFVRGVTDLVQSYSRQEMLEATQNWLPPGTEPDFYEPGFGSLFADSARPPRRESQHRNDSNNERRASSVLGRIDDNGNNAIVEATSKATLADATNSSAKKTTAVHYEPNRLRGSIVEDVREMLDTAKHEGREDVVSWQEHGLAFRVHKKAEFMQDFLPRFFKSQRYSYFCDVLRTWGFVRLKKGPDNGAYFHKLFVQGDPTLSLHMSRGQMKAAMGEWPHEGKEPFLYTKSTELTENVAFSRGKRVAEELAATGKGKFAIGQKEK